MPRRRKYFEKSISAFWFSRKCRRISLIQEGSGLRLSLILMLLVSIWYLPKVSSKDVVVRDKLLFFWLSRNKRIALELVLGVLSNSGPVFRRWRFNKSLPWELKRFLSVSQLQVFQTLCGHAQEACGCFLLKSFWVDLSWVWTWTD